MQYGWLQYSLQHNMNAQCARLKDAYNCHYYYYYYYCYYSDDSNKITIAAITVVLLLLLLLPFQWGRR